MFKSCCHLMKESNLGSHRLFSGLTSDDGAWVSARLICIYCMLFVVVVIRAYDDSLRASQKREQELKEKLNTAEQDSQEKDQKYSRLENDMFGMEKKMATVTDEYKQQQELLEKLQEKGII